MLWRGLFSARYRYCRQAPRYPFYPIPTNSARLDNISNRIMSGEGFQQTPLPDSVPLLASAESRAVCNPLEMRGTAIRPAAVVRRGHECLGYATGGPTVKIIAIFSGSWISLLAACRPRVFCGSSDIGALSMQAVRLANTSKNSGCRTCLHLLRVGSPFDAVPTF
jgi:hypothetical protein